jgi:integrase
LFGVLFPANDILFHVRWDHLSALFRGIGYRVKTSSATRSRTTMTPLEWKSFSSELIGLYTPRRRAPKTRTMMVQVLREFGEFAASTSDLTPANISRWIESRPDRIPITFNGHLSYLRRACNYAVNRDYLGRSPFATENFRLRVGRRKARRHLSRVELAKLLVYLEARHLDTWQDGRLHALAMLLAHTGLRAMEALRLKVEDLDLDQGVLEVVARTRLKSEASEATVPIPPAAIECLRSWTARCGSPWLFPGSRKLGPWVSGSNGKRPADFLDAAGIAAGLPPGTTLLMLRHTLATHARTSYSLSAEQLRQILRHTEVKTQDHYLQRDMENLRGAVALIDFRGRPPV